jgi:hypothetical protein
MVTASRDSVSESGRGWVAIPDVGEEGIDGAQVVMRFFILLFPPSRLPFFSPLNPPIAPHDPWRR